MRGDGSESVGSRRDRSARKSPVSTVGTMATAEPRGGGAVALLLALRCRDISRRAEWGGVGGGGGDVDAARLRLGHDLADVGRRRPLSPHFCCCCSQNSEASFRRPTMAARSHDCRASEGEADGGESCRDAPATLRRGRTCSLPSGGPLPVVRRGLPSKSVCAWDSGEGALLDSTVDRVSVGRDALAARGREWARAKLAAVLACDILVVELPSPALPVRRLDMNRRARTAYPGGGSKALTGRRARAVVGAGVAAFVDGAGPRSSVIAASRSARESGAGAAFPPGLRSCRVAALRRPDPPDVVRVEEAAVVVGHGSLAGNKASCTALAVRRLRVARAEATAGERAEVMGGVRWRYRRGSGAVDGAGWRDKAVGASAEGRDEEAEVGGEGGGRATRREGEAAAAGARRSCEEAVGALTEDDDRSRDESEAADEARTMGWENNAVA